MVYFLVVVALMAVSFLAGYWVADHPQDARDMGARLRARVSELFRKKTPPPGPPAPGV